VNRKPVRFPPGFFVLILKPESHEMELTASGFFLAFWLLN